VEAWSGRISVAFLSGHCAVAGNGCRPGGQPHRACTGPTDNNGRRERASTGRGEAQSAGDSQDDAVAETINGLHKAEVI